MNNYTSIEQSKKLLELGLKPETADMGIVIFADNTTRILPIDDWDLQKNGEDGTTFVPCWSVGQLLKQIPKEILKDGRKHYIHIVGFADNWGVCHDNEFSHKNIGVQITGRLLIDTVIEYICWLMENKFM